MNFSFALLGHLVGDYLFQNDWMALNKKKSYWICSVHCCLWTISVCLFAQITTWWAILVLFFTHFLQDKTNLVIIYMKAIGQNQFLTGPCAPWSIIVVDNVFHLVTIWLVLLFL